MPPFHRPSFNGASHDVSAKKSAWATPGFLSTLKMYRLIELRVCGGEMESVQIRPTRINGYFRWDCIIIGVDHIIHFPEYKML